MKKIEGAARASIGKTTIKSSRIEKFSLEVKQLRKEKREIKKRLKRNGNNQPQTLTEYMHIQEKIKKLILHERTIEEDD